MEEPRLFKDILSESVDAAGISAEKLAGASGVPERFVNAFIEAEFASLPAAPYARGYLKKIAEVLEVDADELWRAFERESNPRQAGKNDYLPQNRFLIKPFTKKIAAISVSALLLIVYLSFNAERLLGAPQFLSIYPEESVSQKTDGLALIRGRIGNAKDIVTINGTSIYVDEFGEFQKEFSLDPGINSFEITAKRFLGRSKKEIRQVIYEPVIENENIKNNKVE